MTYKILSLRSPNFVVTLYRWTRKIACLSLILFVMTVHAQIFVNGGFEEGTNNGWTGTGSTWPAGASISGSATAQSGTCAAMLISSGTTIAERELNLLPGLNATISGYMKPTVLTGSGKKARIDLAIVDANDVEQTINLGTLTTSGTTYKQYTINSWIPLGTKSTKLRLTLAGSGTAYFDSFTVQYTTGKQLISNRGFENSPDFVNWVTSNSCAITNTGTYSGTKAAVITPGAGTKQITQDFTLAAGQTITVRGYMKTVNTGTAGGNISLRCFNSSGTPINENIVIGGTNTTSDILIGGTNGTTNYTQYQRTLSISGTSGVVRGQLRLYAFSSTGSVYFDDLSVIEGDGTVRAFPGAEGFGAVTPGGRGDTADTSNVIVYRVTDLRDSLSGSIFSAHSGTGTLRFALQRNGSDGKRYYVLFPREGVIDLHTGTSTTMINVKQPFVTLAGQTAPGRGIAMKNAGLKITTHDVAIRGMRFRIGGIHYTGSGTNTGVDNLDEDNRDCLSFDQGGTEVYNCIVDQCSFAWSSDEQIQFRADTGDGIYGNLPLKDITVSYCLFTEPLDNPWHLVKDNQDKHHAYQMSVDAVEDLTLHHNAMLHGQRRQPEIRNGLLGSRTELINNLIYNFETVATEFYGFTGTWTGTYSAANQQPMHALVIGNIYNAGPNSTFDPEDPNDPKSVKQGIRFNWGHPPEAGSTFYISDNFYVTGTTVTPVNDWSQTDHSPSEPDPTVDTEEEAMTPSQNLTRTPMATPDLLRNVLLGEAGKLKRPGAYPRDSIDERAISDVLTDTGGIRLYTGTITPNGTSPGPQGETPGPKAKNSGWRTIPDLYRMQDEYGDKNGLQYDDWDEDTFFYYGGYQLTIALNQGTVPKIRALEYNFGAADGLMRQTSYTQLASYSGTGPYGFVAGNTYTGTLTMQRTGTSAVSMALSISGTFAHGTGNTCTLTQSDTTAPTSVFDTIAFYVKSGSGFTSLKVDDVVVKHQTTTLMNDSFGDGERATQNLPSSAAWFANGGSSASVSGNALVISPASSSLAYFTAAGQPRTLAVGETLQATFTLVVNGSTLPAGLDFLRVALLNSSGTPFNHSGTGIAQRVAADGYEPRPDDDDNGISNDMEDPNQNGVPDAWESNYAGGNPFDPVAISADGDGGYLNVEIYANSFIPPLDK